MQTDTARFSSEQMIFLSPNKQCQTTKRSTDYHTVNDNHYMYSCLSRFVHIPTTVSLYNH